MSEAPTAKPTWRELMRQGWRLWALAGFALVLLFVLRSIVLPVVFGVLLAYLLIPVIRRLARRVRRSFAVVLVYLGMLAFSTGFFVVFIPGVLADLGTLRESTPRALATIDEQWIPAISQWVDEATGGALRPESPAEPRPSEVVLHPRGDGSFRVDLSEAYFELHESGSGWVIEAQPRQPPAGIGHALRDLLVAKGDELDRTAGALARRLAAGVAAFLGHLILAFLVAAYVLIDLERIQTFLRARVPPSWRDEFDELITGLDQGMAGVLRGQLLICLINGLLTWIGLLIFGVKYSLLLALLAALLSLVPVYGSLISALPIMAVALVSNDIVSDLAFGKSVAILGWLIVIHLLEANWLNPKIIGATAHIHPVVVVFALLAGYTVHGAAGALLAIPTVSIIQSILILSHRRSDEFAGRSGVMAVAVHDAVERAGDD